MNAFVGFVTAVSVEKAGVAAARETSDRLIRPLPAAKRRMHVYPSRGDHPKLDDLGCHGFTLDDGEGAGLPHHRLKQAAVRATGFPIAQVMAGIDVRQITSPVPTLDPPVALTTVPPYHPATPNLPKRAEGAQYLRL